MSAANSIKLVLPSEVRVVNLAHSVAEEIARLVGFDEDAALEAALAVREAVINAVVHGNENVPGSDVRLTFGMNRDTMTTTVRDRGAGFDPEALADPRMGDNRFGESGRGILMMRAYSDTVAFHRPESGGTEVTLTKRLLRDGGNDESDGS